jgi:predicted ATPase
MKIERIEIVEYRGCVKTEFEINPNLTALIGINGSGKTTILNSISYLKDSISRSRMYHINNEDLSSVTEITSSFIDDTGHITLKACIKSGYNNQIDEDVFEVTTEWKIPEISSRKWFDVPIELLNKDIFENIDNIEKRNRQFNRISYEKVKEIKRILSPEILERLFNVSNFMRSINYYSATQFSDPTKSPISVELDEREKNRLYRSYRNRGYHSQFIIDLFLLKENDPKAFASYINLIGLNGIGLLNTIEFDKVQFKSEEVKVKSAGRISTETQTKTVIVPKIYLDKNILSLNQLSEGTLKTIALLFYIIRETGSLLLIEEPEVCIHHGLLASIIEVIKKISKNKQIIISTHSDFVIDQLLPENIVVVTNDTITGITSQKLSKVLSKNSYKALHEYLSASGNLGEYWKEGGFDE